MKIKNWEFRNLDKNNAVRIANEYSLPFFLSMMLDLRGYSSYEEIESFLNDRPEFSDPFLLPDMEKAVRRIEKAIDEFEAITVFGDYDADGVTATSILYTYFESRGANVSYYIPHRENEGYGMNENAIRKLHEQGTKLIVTVDNGISAINEAKLAKELNIDLVITDHHRPQSELPHALAIVDPFVSEKEDENKYLSGAGVALKLVMAMEDEENRDYIIENYADLAAIGTIADIVPLVGENRTIVKHGLSQIKETNRPGLYALLKESGVLERKMNANLLAFTVVPRINAVGRVGSPNEAVKLLICDDPQEANELALDVCDANNIRKDIENEIVEAALKRIEDNPQWLSDNVLVVDGKSWHPGVLGIVASRITEKFGKPTIIISVFEDTAKGSGRSIEGFSLFDALTFCKDELIQFGGHTMAAGLTVEPLKIDDFRKKINSFCLESEIPVSTITIDCKLKPSSLSVEMPRLISHLEPFGTDNPQPIFALCGMTLENITPVGNGKHLRLLFKKDTASINCMKFGCTIDEFQFKKGDVLDLAVVLEAQMYRSNETLSVYVKDIKFTDIDTEKIISSVSLYNRFISGRELTKSEKETLLPDREFFAKLYRFIKANAPINMDEITLYKRSECEEFSKFLTALDVFEERGLISLKKETNNISIDIINVKEKTDLLASEIAQRLIN